VELNKSILSISLVNRLSLFFTVFINSHLIGKKNMKNWQKSEDVFARQRNKKQYRESLIMFAALLGHCNLSPLPFGRVTFPIFLPPTPHSQSPSSLSVSRFFGKITEFTASGDIRTYFQVNIK